MYVQGYKQLIVWQKSFQLVIEIYKITKLFPKEEVYCLSNQMRRASISIASNIAEGYKRKGLGEYIQFLSVSDASAAELETQLLIAKELYKEINYCLSEDLLIEIEKMLAIMIKKLNAKRYYPKP